MLSCKSDDDANPFMPVTLNGSWSLVQVTGGFAGVDDSFDHGVIVWEFNKQTSQVTINNANEEDTIFDGFPSGMYPFETSVSEDVTTITIDGIDMNLTTLTPTELELDEGVAFDGFFLSFNRN